MHLHLKRKLACQDDAIFYGNVPHVLAEPSLFGSLLLVSLRKRLGRRYHCWLPSERKSTRQLKRANASLDGWN